MKCEVDPSKVMLKETVPVLEQFPCSVVYVLSTLQHRNGNLKMLHNLERNMRTSQVTFCFVRRIA